MARLDIGALRRVPRAGVVGSGVVLAAALGASLAVSHGASVQSPAAGPAADDLRRDLDAAAAAAAFAPAVRGGAPVRFVSPLELGERSAPAAPAASLGPARTAPRQTVARTRAPRSAPRSAPRATTREYVPVHDVADRTPARAVSPATVTGDAAPAPGAPEQVAAALPASAGAGTYTAPTDIHPAGASGTLDGPSGDPPGGGGAAPAPHGHGGWGGGIIGVVIRGGGIGDADHCERDRPRGRLPFPGSIGGGGMGGGRWPGRF